MRSRALCLAHDAQHVSGKRLVGRWLLLVLFQFLGKQRKHHLMPTLVARWITLAGGDQFAIPRNIFLLDVPIHRHLHGSFANTS
jgi:hypothetical protein